MSDTGNGGHTSIASGRHRIISQQTPEKDQSSTSNDAAWRDSLLTTLYRRLSGRLGLASSFTYTELLKIGMICLVLNTVRGKSLFFPWK